MRYKSNKNLELVYLVVAVLSAIACFYSGWRQGESLNAYCSKVNGRISGGPVRNYEGIGDRLRNLREQAGIPQRAIAKATGTTQSCVSRLEDFMQTPGISLSTCGRLATN